MFSAKTYQERRRKLKEQVGSGVILLLGNDLSPMNYADNTYDFRQDSSFLYFFGLDFEGLNAIIDADSGAEIIFGDELTIDHIVWMGTQPTIAEKAQKVAVDTTASTSKLAEVLRDEKTKGRRIHFLPPYRPANMIKLHQWLDIPISQLSSQASLELVKAVIAQREIKSEEELAQIDIACTISTEMHIAAMKTVKAGLTEAQIAANARAVALSHNSDVAFPVIATINGQTLHNHYHGNIIKSGKMFLLDTGAESPMHYAGDLSSTMPVDKKFSERQKEIYNISLAAHEAAIAELRPGNEFRNAHLAAARTIANGMKELGMMKGDINEAITAGAHAMFFQCGTGHMMGLDVHDMEDLGEVWVGYDGEPKSTQFGLKSLRLAKKLQPGYVLTVEPGIYFIPELIDMWNAENKFSEFLNYDKINEYRDFGGIRNEEDFVITEDGFRLLGNKKKPKTVEEVEELSID
ncbi:MAG: aminopeptidase P family protein [Bacteroidetes bacterium]|nr:aminopeptidase P family protein [Bacteroidota bacterium]